MTKSDDTSGQSRTRSQTEVVVEDIKSMIMRGDLTPGSRLAVESDLAATLGVSRSSLREGVRALAVMGILETRQGDGTFVTSLDPSLLMAPMSFVVDLQRANQIAHISVVRRVLEMEAAARAAQHITVDQLGHAAELLASVNEVSANPTVDDLDQIMDADIAFHRIVAHASQNPALEALIEALSSRTVRTRTWRAITEHGATAATQREHAGVLDALSSRDPDRARLLMGAHLFEVERFAANHPDTENP